MTTYGYTNSDGEPIMDGAAYRYEQYLDSTYEPEFDPYRDDYEGDEPECDDEHDCNDCDGPGGIWTKEGVFTPHEGAHWRCSWCHRPCPEGAHTD